MGVFDWHVLSVVWQGAGVHGHRHLDHTHGYECSHILTRVHKYLDHTCGYPSGHQKRSATVMACYVAQFYNGLRCTTIQLFASHNFTIICVAQLYNYLRRTALQYLRRTALQYLRRTALHLRCTTLQVFAPHTCTVVCISQLLMLHTSATKTS